MTRNSVRRLREPLQSTLLCLGLGLCVAFVDSLFDGWTGGGLFSGVLAALSMGVVMLWLREDRVVALDSLSRQAALERLLLTLFECGRTVARAKDSAEVFAPPCRILVDSGGFGAAAVWRPDGAGGLRAAHVWGGSSEALSRVVLPLEPPRPAVRTPSAEAFTTRRCVVVSEMAADPRVQTMRPFWEKEGLRALIAVPVLENGVCSAVLVVLSKEPERFGGETERLLSTLALDMGHALESLRLSGDLEVANDALGRTVADCRRVSRAVECAAESIIVTDEKGVIQYVNPACARVTGYSREELLGAHTRALKSGVHPPEFYRGLWETIASGKVWAGHLVNRSKGGTLYEEDASIAPVMDERGVITNFVAVKKDVTKELSLESQLLQSQKLEAVGRLAGGVAHDFNNILTAILGYATLGQQSLPEGTPLRDDLAEIEKGARRAAELTRQLLIFSRKQVIKPQVLDPAQVAAGLQKMLRRIVGEDVRLRFVAESRGARILADPGQLEQVVLNFVVNARDAMPKGGEVEVAVREALLVEPRPGVDGPILPGTYAVVSVRDTGRGIPPAVLPRIFEPFFTTKAVGEGSGLGLSTVYGIVKQGGAFLAVDTAPDVGTTMSVYWPTTEGALPEEAPSAPARGGDERVLLVEDEPAVLHLTQRLLMRAGYSVTAFPEASAALAWASGPEAMFEVLLTDVVLPGGTSGKGLAEALLARRPGLKVLYTSGYSDDIISNHGVLDPGTSLLPKPFTEDALLRAVRAALAG